MHVGTLLFNLQFVWQPICAGQLVLTFVDLQAVWFRSNFNASCRKFECCLRVLGWLSSRSTGLPSLVLQNNADFTQGNMNWEHCFLVWRVAFLFCRLAECSECAISLFTSTHVFGLQSLSALLGSLQPGCKWTNSEDVLRAANQAFDNVPQVSISTRKSTCEPGRRKHKHKQRHACACVVPVHTYFFLCLHLCLRRTCEPALMFHKV